MSEFLKITYKVSFSNSNFSTSVLKTLITSFDAWTSSLNAATISGVESSKIADEDAKDPTDFTCSRFGLLGDPIPPNDPELADLFSLRDLRILLKAWNNQINVLYKQVNEIKF